MSPTYDAVAETIGNGPGLARFAIGISAVAQPELYWTDYRDHRRGRGVALRVRGALLLGERGGRHGCVVARLERDVVRTGAKAVSPEDELDRLHHRERHWRVEVLQREVRDDQEVGLPRSTMDGRVACSGRERLQACDRRRRFDGSPTTRRDRRPDTRRRHGDVHRRVPELEAPDGLRLRIDAKDLAVHGTCDPERSVPEREPAGRKARSHRVCLQGRPRLDPPDRPGKRIAHPHRRGSDRDRPHLRRGERDPLRHFQRHGVDALHTSPDAGPDRPEPGGQRARPPFRAGRSSGP